MGLKKALTPEERIKAAYLHYIGGMEEMLIAIAFEVNVGRVSEACKAIHMTALDPKGMRRAIENADEEQELLPNGPHPEESIDAGPSQ